MYNFIQKPHEYNPQIWKPLTGHNCYMYAINYCGDNPTVCPGEISGFDFSDFDETGYFPTSELKKRIYQDCNKIGLNIREGGVFEKIAEGEWKIALFEKWIPEEYDYDFHFLREDSPNSWSGKFKCEMPSNLDYANRRITNPLNAEFWAYKFVTVFIISKGT